MSATKNKLEEGLTLLGKSGVTKPTELLESFEAPSSLTMVTLKSSEVTSLCPITGQPDFYTVEVVYTLKFNDGTNSRRCVESKSFKLKLGSYRDKGLFVEAFADDLLNHVVKSIEPDSCLVRITQVPRGGVAIEAQASYQYRRDFD